MYQLRNGTSEIQTEEQDTGKGISFYRGEDKENEVLVKYEKDYPGETCNRLKKRRSGWQEKKPWKNRETVLHLAYGRRLYLGEKSDIHIINPCGESAWWKENENREQDPDTLQYDPR